MNENMMENEGTELMTLTADIVAAHVANNSVSVTDLPLLISNVHTALAGLGSSAAAAAEPDTPSVPIRSSIKPDYIVCLGCGKKMKMLKRHLSTDHDMSVAEYRARWGLRDDYPMVASNYAATRRQLALSIGLGRKSGGRKRAASSK